MLRREHCIQAALKHLPPSAAQLRLLDIGSTAGDVVAAVRPDVHAIPVSVRPLDWQVEESAVDAVLGYDLLANDMLLREVLRVLRAGGRMVIVNPLGQVEESIVRQLEGAGFVRILVESLEEETGVLIRGEKAHETGDTHERIQVAAARDAGIQTIETYQGRFVHLLIRQYPQKPVWRLLPEETVEWHAVAIEKGRDVVLLGFSSLPKAVSFMQVAVMNGTIKDVSKVAKFRREVVRSWEMTALINPELADIQEFSLCQVEIDPKSAETPDE